MAALHILHGGIKNPPDRDWLLKAAKQNLATRWWIVPKRAQAGDDAVIYVGTTFFATARITSQAAPRPEWGPRAYGAGLDSIQLIEPSIPIDVIRKRLPLLTWANYPRSVTTPTPQIASQIRRLIQRVSGTVHLSDDDKAADIELILKDRKLKNETSRMALIDARLGQGRFRADLIERWKGACAVTRCALRDVLRASHIKPWKNSSNKERLDSANGFLLSANIDVLFDSGLVTFEDGGRMLVSKLIPAIERKRLGIPRNMVRKPDREERGYLAEHRLSRFRG
jgi:hypothetical protein